MAQLEKFIKVTQEQYNTLQAGGTVGSYTGIDPNFIYLVENHSSTDVEANPSDDATDTLTTLKVGDVTYSLPSSEKWAETRTDIVINDQFIDQHLSGSTVQIPSELIANKSRVTLSLDTLSNNHSNFRSLFIDVKGIKNTVIFIEFYGFRKYIDKLGSDFRFDIGSLSGSSAEQSGWLGSLSVYMRDGNPAPVYKSIYECEFQEVHDGGFCIPIPLKSNGSLLSHFNVGSTGEGWISIVVSNDITHITVSNTANVY